MAEKTQGQSLEPAPAPINYTSEESKAALAAASLLDLGTEQEDARRFEFANEVHFKAKFDAEMLAGLDLDSLAGHEDTFDDTINPKQQAVERVRKMIEVFSRLPELEFNAGITAIFGDNGAGKTILSDVIIAALQMEVFCHEQGISKSQLTTSNEGSSHMFVPSIPGYRLNQDGDPFARAVSDSLREIIGALAKCLKVSDLTLLGDGYTKDLSFTMARALRPSTAFTRPLPGSTQQSIAMFAGIEKKHQTSNPPSVTLVDEPELGLSPTKQRDLANSMSQTYNDGGVYLMPTNSILLYEDPGIPRIDLDFPEKGVHLSQTADLNQSSFS